jgi:hypothetical protein
VPSDYLATWIHGHFSMGNETYYDDDDGLLTNGYQWLSMDINGYQLLLLDINAY